MTALNLGFIPLTDCAPLAVGKAKGFFAGQNLDVTLSREASWATVRDKVAIGALDAAHMLAPMTLAASLGIGGSDVPMVAPLALNRNGAAFTISAALGQALRRLEPEAMAQTPPSAQTLARLIAERKRAGEPALTFAVVFPYSIHNYALRYWLGQAGIDPDRDVRLIVTPPVRMVDQLRAGTIDGFCVGAPWNAVAVSEGLGEVLIRASEIWPGGSDKVLGTTQAWSKSNPEALQALLRALLQAGAWADAPDNRAELSELLGQPEYLGARAELIGQGLDEEILFQTKGSACPVPSQGVWFLTQMMRWGQIPTHIDPVVAAAEVYRPDLYRTAAKSLGLEAVEPQLSVDEPEVFFDGHPFRPNEAVSYARAFAITRAKR